MLFPIFIDMNKEKTLEEIRILLKSNDAANIDVAFQLAKGQGVYNELIAPYQEFVAWAKEVGYTSWNPSDDIEENIKKLLKIEDLRLDRKCF